MNYSDLKAGMKLRAAWDPPGGRDNGVFVVVEVQRGWLHRLLCELGMRRREYFISSEFGTLAPGHAFSDLSEFEPA